MDYKDKYNKLVNAIKVLQETNPSDEGIQNWVNDNVPELCESEDERIRKEFCKDIWTFIPNEKAHKYISWLEKHGKCETDCHHNHQDANYPNGCIVLEDFNGGEGFYKLNLDYLNKKQVEEVEEMVRTWNKDSKVHNENIKSCIGMCLTDVCEQRFKDYNTSLKDCLVWLEKQGGIDNCPLEGSADCVTTDSRKQGNQGHSEQDLEMVAKPKFNIGDWITSDETYINNDYRLCKVVGIGDGCYTIQTINGLKVYNTFKGWESDYRLWSIEDAKPGDVLVYHNTATEIIMLFKSWVEKRESAYTHFHIFDNNYRAYRVNASCDCGYGAHPATKEQRDTLFSKMREAGYTFDFGKKELKKLKFRVGDEVITKNEESLTITKIDEEGYWSNDLFICDFDSECVWDLVG